MDLRAIINRLAHSVATARASRFPAPSGTLLTVSTQAHLAMRVDASEAVSKDGLIRGAGKAA
jgi:hypothetical protein